MNETDLAKLHPRFLTPFRWDIFWKKQRVMIEQNGLTSTLPSMGFHLGVYLFNQLAWLLDGIFPSTVPTPQTDQSLFIAGHQRSGTTFLHRLLAGNDWAHSLDLHEMLFPASSFQHCLHTLSRLDQATGDHVLTRLNTLQERFLGHLDNIHRVRFNEPEEDEFVMWSQYASDICINDSPTLIDIGPKGMPKEFEFWTPEEQYSALMWYRACIQKKLQRQRGTGIYVGKNPRFSRILPQLNTVFPGSKVIVLIRNPLEAIPSRMSLTLALWGFRKPKVERLSPAHVRWILQHSIDSYLKNEAGIKHIPEERRIIVGYNDLKTTPRQTLRSIVEHLNLPELSPIVTAQIDELEKQSYRSKHHYDLSEYGLTPADIEGPLAPIISKYQHLF